tara:strand:+ start:1604 stop:3451 length:1848 start_codon:yes stop_codon:yes gene_type:complete
VSIIKKLEQRLKNTKLESDDAIKAKEIWPLFNMTAINLEQVSFKHGLINSATDLNGIYFLMHELSKIYITEHDVSKNTQLMEGSLDLLQPDISINTIERLERKLKLTFHYFSQWLNNASQISEIDADYLHAMQIFLGIIKHNDLQNVNHPLSVTIKTQIDNLSQDINSKVQKSNITRIKASEEKIDSNQSEHFNFLLNRSYLEMVKRDIGPERFKNLNETLNSHSDTIIEIKNLLCNIKDCGQQLVELASLKHLVSNNTNDGLKNIIHSNTNNNFQKYDHFKQHLDKDDQDLWDAQYQRLAAPSLLSKASGALSYVFAKPISWLKSLAPQALQNMASLPPLTNESQSRALLLRLIDKQKNSFENQLNDLNQNLIDKITPLVDYINSHLGNKTISVENLKKELEICSDRNLEDIVQRNQLASELAETFDKTLTEYRLHTHKLEVIQSLGQNIDVFIQEYDKWYLEITKSLAQFFKWFNLDWFDDDLKTYNQIDELKQIKDEFEIQHQNHQNNVEIIASNLQESKAPHELKEFCQSLINKEHQKTDIKRQYAVANDKNGFFNQIKNDYANEFKPSASAPDADKPETYNGFEANDESSYNNQDLDDESPDHTPSGNSI